MLGLERLHLELSSARHRVVRLIEMEKLSEQEGLYLVECIYNAIKKVEELMEGDNGKLKK